MPIYQLSNSIYSFPPAWLADESGVVAVGGDLYPDRILEAYRQGIFPWFNPNEPPLWWSPDPRFVLPPAEVKVHKSLKQVLRNKGYRVTFDQAFPEVLNACQTITRPGQIGTWLSDELKQSFIELFHRGFAHSVEVWLNNRLVGGLYGGAMGKCFFGESMFALERDASKVGFVTLCRNLAEKGFDLVDCQVHTNHLESLGARFISRDNFLELIYANQQHNFEKQDWNTIFRDDYYK